MVAVESQSCGGYPSVSFGKLPPVAVIQPPDQDKRHHNYTVVGPTVAKWAWLTPNGLVVRSWLTGLSVELSGRIPIFGGGCPLWGNSALGQVAIIEKFMGNYLQINGICANSSVATPDTIFRLDKLYLV
jgi:hypothetical protein